MHRWLFSLFFLANYHGRHDGALAIEPEANMTTPQIIAHWDYPAEEHQVTTRDGYILNVHRIPHGKGETVQNDPRPVIFLQHGLLGSSADWVLNMPWQSAGFFFADAGFDVWLGNFRGNVYSREHVKYTVEQKEFWQFTWDQMAAYDLPAMIDYILQHSGVKRLHYVGHSMGTMTAFAAFSSDQKLGSKCLGLNPEQTFLLETCILSSKQVDKFFALGPVATVGYIGGLLRVIEPISSKLDFMLELIQAYEFLPPSHMMDWMSVNVCGLYFSVQNPLCKNVMFLIAGQQTYQWNQTRLPVIMEHTPAGTSTKNVIHFAQQVRSKKFQAFNWGTDAKNMQFHRQKNPPIYNATDFNVETYLFSGSLDILSDPIDVALLAIQLPNLKQNNILPTFNHFDFLWGLNAVEDVYEKILKIIQNGSRHRRHDSSLPNSGLS